MLKATSSLDSIGGRIRYYRLINNYSQEDLAQLVNLDYCTINRYENNQTVFFDLEVVNIIASALNINPYLLYDNYLSFIASDYGSTIKSIRKKFKLTQKEFAKMIGVHRKTVGRWEKRINTPLPRQYFLLEKYIKKS